MYKRLVRKRSPILTNLNGILLPKMKKGSYQEEHAGLDVELIGIKPFNRRFLYSFGIRIPLYQSTIPETCDEKGIRAIHVKRRKLLGQCATRIIFEHFKDETNIEKCETLEEVKQEIKRYI